MSVRSSFYFLLLFFFNDPPPTEIYTLSLHDALPISKQNNMCHHVRDEAEDASLRERSGQVAVWPVQRRQALRSEEHTSELQSHSDLVCRLLLEKKKKQ